MVQMKQSLVSKFTKDELIIMYTEEDTFKCFIKRIGYKSYGDNSSTVRRHLVSINLDISKYREITKKYKGVNGKKSCTYSLEQILVENSTYTDMSSLKKRLISMGYIRNRCYICDLGPQWNGMNLVLHMDHVNGTHNDNRLVNLRMLCPNCHTQTDTYTGRNIKNKRKTIKVIPKCTTCSKQIAINTLSGKCTTCVVRKRKVKNRPSLERLLKDIAETSYVSTGKKYGVSDNAIRKWIKAYGSTPPKKYKMKK